MAFLELLKSSFIKKSRDENAEREREVELEKEAAAVFSRRVTDYNRSFGPYNRSSPNFDYVKWKPKGSDRRDDREMGYYKQCRALVPWVTSTAEALSEGREEQKWQGMVGQPKVLMNVYSRPVSKVPTRAASAELLATPTGRS